MNAKYVVNEIKQNVLGSGLSRIRVGKDRYNVASKYINETYPNTISNIRLKNSLIEFVHTVRNNSREFLKEAKKLIDFLSYDIDSYMLLHISEDNKREFLFDIHEKFLSHEKNNYDEIIKRDIYSGKKWEASFLSYVNVEDGIGYVGFADLVSISRKEFRDIFVRV